jgi:hypothetical protein
VVRAQGRKIIFTTNLPNVNDIDDALMRPGRCFASIRTRLLNHGEAAALIIRLVNDRSEDASVLSRLFPPGTRGVSVAEIYRACRLTQTAAL